MQCANYLHEFPIKKIIDSPKLNPKANANLLVHFYSFET